MEVYVIVNGVSYNLNDGALGYLSGHDGLGLPPLHRLTERGPQQHGETDLGFRLAPRIFSLVFTLPASNNNGYYQNRDTLLRYIKPMDAALSWRFVLDNGETRQIDCHAIDAPLAFDAGEIYLLGKAGVQYKAPEPTFYDPVEGCVTFALGGGGDSFDIPLAIPWKVGVSTLDQSRTISYPGSWRTYPVIKIEGPITDCAITNDTTGEVLDFTGTTIAAGDYYEIDCRYGYKTVTDSNGANKIADLTTDSDLATFHLAAAIGGNATRENSITVTGSAVTAATEVYFRYKERYIGL